MERFNYCIPTKLLFGVDALNSLAKEPLPGKRALVVISAGTSMRKYGYLDRVLDLLKHQNVEGIVYDKILPNPVYAHVMEGAALARENGCDFVIGLGGGSSIDSAKSIAVMVNNPGEYWDYVSGGTGKGMPLTQPVLPIVAIATTAGTGTEIDPWTVITYEERHEKIGFGVKETFPVLSIVDPMLMLSIPPHLTAFQGFDALFHATEGYIAKIATPMSDLYALESIAKLSDYLPDAVADGKDVEARTQVALASSLSGMVESTSSCTSEHSMEHAMSAFYPELPHGAGLIIISEAYYRFFAKYVPERFIYMAEAMGVDTDQLPLCERPMSFVDALVEMQKACGVDQLKMSDYGIIPEDFERFATNALETMGGLFTLDYHPLTREEIIQIYQESYK